MKGPSLICAVTHTSESFPKYRAGIISRGLEFKKHPDLIYQTTWQNLDLCLNTLKLKPPREKKKKWWNLFKSKVES